MGRRSASWFRYRRRSRGIAWLLLMNQLNLSSFQLRPTRNELLAEKLRKLANTNQAPTERLGPLTPRGQLVSALIQNNDPAIENEFNKNLMPRNWVQEKEPIPIESPVINTQPVTEKPIAKKKFNLSNLAGSAVIGLGTGVGQEKAVSDFIKTSGNNAEQEVLSQAVAKKLGITPEQAKAYIGQGGDATKTFLTDNEPIQPDVIKFYADQVEQGITPNYGMGGYKLRMAVAQEVENRKRANPNSPNMASAQSDFKSLSAVKTDLMKRLHVMKSTMNVFEASANAALEQSARVGRTEIPVLNKVIQYIQNGFVPNAELASFNAQIYNLARDYAKVSQGQLSGQAVTDTATKAAEQLISAAQNPTQFAAVVNAMREDGRRNPKGYEEQLNTVNSQISKLGKSPSAGANTSEDSVLGKVNKLQQMGVSSDDIIKALLEDAGQ